MAVRLTERSGDGIRYDNGQYIVTCYPKNNNLTPVDKMAAKLCDLEDKIENGTLVAFPCKVGDVVYRVSFVNKHIEQLNVEGFLRNLASWKAHCTHVTPSWLGNQKEHIYISFSSFGKTVFLTREEAEAALKERNNHE